MKPNGKSNYSPGDPIKASDLNNLARNANRAASQAGSSGQFGVMLDDFQGTMARPGVLVYMARMTRDVLPVEYEEHNDLEVEDNFNFNAVRQIWDENGDGWYDKNGEELFVEANQFPLLKDDILPVYYNAASRKWVPLEERAHEMVEVASSRKNDDGFYDGFVTRWQNDDRYWLRTRACHVLDGNDPAYETRGPVEE